MDFARNIIDKYRKEADDFYNNTLHRDVTWREAILESIFRPTLKLPEGKGPMTHLHPDIKKLHLPEGIYIADWRKYKVEDHPALVNFQKRCHAAGLHDPWLRNYAHMFYPNNRACRSRWAFISTGLGFGFFAGLGLFLTHKTFHYFFPPNYEHSEEYLAAHKGHH